mmetsp:Transcript_104286/g.262459  ORF Transcript_104286/g.262459 Transcript_104286/m.262459 type:complete len:3286 (+) Transcript_104286:57-9914(+)
MHALLVRWGAPSRSSHAAILLVAFVSSLLEYCSVDAQTAGVPSLDDDTTLSMELEGDIVECVKPPAPTCGPEVAKLIAGIEIQSMALLVGDANYFPATGLASAAFMLVNTSVTEDALTSDPNMCHPTSAFVVGSSEVYSPSGAWKHIQVVPPYGAKTELDQAHLSGLGYYRMQLQPSEVPLEFRMGGEYKLCYSQDARFGEAIGSDVLLQTMVVWGVYDKRQECKTDDTCMRTKKHRCYVLREAYNNINNTYAAGSSCIVDYTYAGAGFEGSAEADFPKASWSREYEANYNSTGHQIGATRAFKCGQEPPANFLCHSTTSASCTPGDYFQPEFVGSNGIRFNLPPAIDWLGNDTVPRFEPRTIALCYCAYDLCVADEEYKQQVGILLYYATKVCYNSFQGEIDCRDDFTGAAPQHRFSLRVLCPPDGCVGNTENRVKIVPQDYDNDQPSWATSSASSVTGCFTALHGKNGQNKTVLPPDDNPQVTVISGRGQRDFKIWNWKSYLPDGTLNTTDPDQSGFMFNMGSTDHEKRSGGGAEPVGGETFDVCYCDGDCTVAGNWFKVGQLRYVPFQLVSAAQNTSTKQEDFVIEYAMQPGIFGFYRTVADRGAMGMNDGAMLKLVADPTNSITDEGCADDPNLPYDPKYDRDLVFPGPMIDFYYKTAYAEYAGMSNETVDPNKFLFNNGTLDNQITVRKAGFLAVCYCSGHEDGVCFSNAWVLAARLTIRGPKEGHVWSVSTNVLFKLEYEGWGLSSNDQLRIIPATSECTDGGDDYGPSGAYTKTQIKLRCPYPCSEVGEPTSSLHGGIDTKIVADDAWQCDVNNADCRNNDIKRVTVLDSMTTEIEFEKNHGLEDGDKITITDNIECHEEDLPDECNDARLEVLKGAFRFADNILGDQPVNAPTHYYSGHIITIDPVDGKKLTIPVGWPTAPLRPRFEVKFRNNKRGRWLRHSRASTKLEIKGERALENLKVCWAYPTPTAYPKYTAEVGTITLEDPNTMQNCRVTLTSLVKGQQAPWAPFIVSFSAAGSETGKRYSRVEGQTSLRLFFTSSTSALYATMGDGANININAAEDEATEAKQYICGKLFKELWGSDPDLGFPMPRGCFYTVYGVTQEINIVFETKNGLVPGQDYQMVMTGVAMDEAKANEVYAEIFTMDDKPYTAIERGRAILSQSPMSPAYGTEGVEFFRPDGVKVVSRTEPDMMELTGSNSITLALRGEPSGGGIKASAIMRIFLWPITQWNIARSCTALCTPHDDITHPCGAVQDCKGENLIPNMHRNYIKVVFPEGMSTITDEVSHQLTIMGLHFPTGGFFPTRFGVELRRPDDTKPDYVETVGNYFFKKPDDGASIGKLVEFWGDGDQKPFKGGEGNVLYASLMLASTLFAALQSNDAIMEIILPTGYECLYPATDPGVSPWQPPDDLGVFGWTIPQGTGAPFEASAWSGVNNTCKYSLRQNGVIYAGSALLIRITVNNPSFPLKRTDENNRWKVKLTSKGYYSYPLEFPPVVFGSDAELGNYSTNKPVLGMLTDAKIVPQDFAVSLDSLNLQMTYLRIFFRAEQDTSVDAQIRIVPAAGFSFPNPCLVRDIPLTPFNYYASYAIGTQPPTKRLPGILGCNHTMWPGEMVFTHVAGVMSGSFRANTYYAFEALVQNSFSYNHLERNTWQLFTTDGQGNRVDGTPRVDGMWPSSDFDSDIGMLAVSSSNTDLMQRAPSFGLYQRDLGGVSAIFSDLRPFSVAGLAWVEVAINVPAAMDGVLSTLRITAPAGFIWKTGTSEWLQQHIGFPASMEDNVLFWAEKVYSSSKEYRFRSSIQIPDSSPTQSINEIIIEFGHQGSTLGTRYAAGRVTLDPVQAVVAAEVDFSQITMLQDPPNEIVLQFETVSDLPPGGGVYITGPEGYVVARNRDSECMPGPAPSARGSPYEVPSDQCCTTSICTQKCPDTFFLPDDMACKLESLPLDPILINLTAGASGLSAGRYRFLLQAINPAVQVPNPENISRPCGAEICWSFTALNNMADLNSIMDAPTYFPAFPIMKKMVESGLSELTDLQAALTGRDDRPLSENNLVLFFKLTKQMLEPEVLSIRAPKGFIFREDCLSSLEIRGQVTYGAGQDVASGDTAWPVDVKVLACRGEGSNAFIHTDPGIGQGFLASNRYPFRISVFNPRSQPPASENKWVITYGDESSQPFTGFMLWTFERTLEPPLPASIGASLADSSLAKLWNPVTFTFAPHNTIMGAGMQIKVYAPPNFEIANELTNEGLKSRALIQPVSEVPGVGEGDVPPDPSWDSRPSIIWGEEELDCAVDEETGRLLTVTVLSDVRELTAGRDYQMTIFVYNPMRAVEVSQENEWMLDTYNSISASPILPLFRDRIRVQGFAVKDTPRRWTYLNEEPATGLRFYNGLQRVKQLYFEMQFPSKLQTEGSNTKGDIIVLETPAGYKWVDCPGTFKWEPPKDYELYLPSSPRTCVNGDGPLERSNMTIKIMELLAVPAMRMIKFRVDAQNPDKTPHAMLNHWMATHYSGMTGQILSTTAVVSWDIIPQLAEPFIQLVGANVNKAAGTQSRMAISFIPINDADQLELWAKLPQGFDFTGCIAMTDGHEIVTTDLDKVRVRAALYAGVKANIILDDFKLGQIGGPTEFDLTTMLNNGEQMDEALNFEDGFELPGYLLLVDQSIQSEYTMNPDKYPGDREVRMNEVATIKFEFTMTRGAEAGDLLSVSSPLFTMIPDGFTLRYGPGGPAVSTEVVSYVDGTIVVQLRGSEMRSTVPGFMSPSYEITLQAKTPSMPNPTDSMIRIEVRKPGTQVAQLPVNTNDGRDQGFRLVDNVLLRLKKPPQNEAPPMAEVDVELVVDPRSTAPTELLLMAPLMFNFTQDCLVRGGESGEIVSCTLLPPDSSGRAMARLITKAGGLTAPTDYVVIRIKTPSMDPSDPAMRKWFIDVRDDETGLQVGWGEDATGVSIRQMVGAEVIFSGVPQIAGQLSIKFYTAEKVDAGGMIRVIYPRSIVILCDGAFFEPVALQGQIDCYNNAKLGMFDLVMARPMPPGMQAFTVTATPPDAVDDPGGNIFKILVYTPDGKVVDAAMNVPGNRIEHGITLSALELIWGSSDGGKASQISVGFELLAEMPEVEPPLMSEVVVTLPETFEHVVTRASHIEVLGAPFPFRNPNWLNVDNPRKVKLLMDEKAVATLPLGLYRFSFPALLPTKMPKFNVFLVSICGPNLDGTNATCSGDPQDPRVITTFPLAGFQLGDEHPSAMQYMAASPAIRLPLPLTTLALGLLSLLFLLPRPSAAATPRPRDVGSLG